ncbi:MAG: CPBP family intramembrane metalloprotease, partial [Sphingobacteriales bacterium]
GYIAAKQAFLILIFTLVLNYSLDYIIQLLHLTFDDSSNGAVFASSNILELLGNLLIAGLLTATFEEILYRGYMYGNLKSVTSKISAGIITSTVFGIMHFDFAYLPLLLVFSLLLCYLREKSQSIIPGIVVHTLYNSFIVSITYLKLF